MKTIMRCLGSTDDGRVLAQVGFALRKDACETFSWPMRPSAASRCGFVKGNIV